MTSFPVRNELGYELVSFEPALEHRLDHDHGQSLKASFVLAERNGAVLLVFDRWRKHWELPGGGREEGESPRTAAVRELLEETGVRTERLIFVGVAGYVCPPDGLREHVAVFRTVLDADAPDPLLSFQPDQEIGAARWWDPTSSRQNVDPLDATIIDLLLAAPATGDQPIDTTRNSYQHAADVYARRTPHSAAHRPTEFLDQVVGLLPDARILEIGSGPGWDADYLEERGLTVQRSDLTPAFVDMMRSGGADAVVLDARTDDLGGPWDGVLANAVLLHLNRTEFAEVIGRVREAVRPGGIFALSLKEGDGEDWTETKLDLPRWFVYWREPELRTVLEAAGWTVQALERRPGGREDWLQVIATN